MLFDMTANSNSRKIMLLNPDYPNDVTLKNTDGTAIFSVVIAKDGRPDKYTYQWYVDGTAVASAAAAEYVRNVSNDKGVHSVWCEVSNKAGTVRTREATLTVKKVPVLNASYPTDITVTIGQSATVAVSISEDGYPSQYTYQWYKNGDAVSGATSSSYTYRSSSIGKDTVYCIVKNEAGFVQSRIASINIEREYIVVNGYPVSGGFGYFNYDPDSIVRHDADGLFILGDGGGSTRAWSTEMFDFTGKNKLVFYCSGFGRVSATQFGTFYFGATDTQNDDGFIAHSAVAAQNSSDTWIIVDVSMLNGPHYIKIALIRDAYEQDWVKIKNVYFE